MTELQRLKRNESRRKWRALNAERVREKDKLDKRKERERNPEKTRDYQRNYRLIQRQKKTPLVYMVQIGELDMLTFTDADYKGLSEYQILKKLREQFARVLSSNIPYTVYKIKPSRFDKVPFD